MRSMIFVLPLLLFSSAQAFQVELKDQPQAAKLSAQDQFYWAELDALVMSSPFLVREEGEKEIPYKLAIESFGDAPDRICNHIGYLKGYASNRDQLVREGSIYLKVRTEESQTEDAEISVYLGFAEHPEPKEGEPSPEPGTPVAVTLTKGLTCVGKKTSK